MGLYGQGQPGATAPAGVSTEGTSSVGVMPVMFVIPAYLYPKTGSDGLDTSLTVQY
jgi:hypothetical protein